MAIVVLKIGIVLLYLFMAVRALQSGTTTDRFLCAALLLGVILMFVVALPLSACWLIACAVAYLASQIMTSARLLSRGLPILAGLLVGTLWWISGAG